MVRAAIEITKTIAKKALVNLTVNGRAVCVPLGSTLLDAVRAAGCHVPTLCHHPEFKPHATCRLCLVNVDGQQKPVPACHSLAKEGSHIMTDSPELKEYRKRDLQFLLSRHPAECIRCEAAGNCQLQNLVKEYQVEDIWPKTPRGSPDHPEHPLRDHTSPAIFRDMDKCIACGLCIEACSAQGINALGFAERGAGMIPTTAFDKPLSQSGCISCGQCTLKCPVGALIERPDWHRVLDVLDSNRRVTVVQTAPATRVGIGEEFGLEPGTVSTGRLINALRKLGFDYVMDTNFTADLTIMEEANELLSRLNGEREGALPMFTSCCPAWINYVEIHRPDLIPHLSTTKSPQQMFSATTKSGPFAASLLPERPFVVSIMPCCAKKDEAVRPGMSGDTDAVLTTRELAKMIKARNIPFASLSNEGSYDSPFGESTGAAVIFGASGGVMEAALRTAADALGMEDAPMEYHQVRGVDRGVKVTTIPGVGSVAVCSSMGAAIQLLSNDDWKKDYIMIEVMACRGGCLGGGGEPKSTDPKVLEKRAKGIYKIDSESAHRKSHENEEVKRLYDEVLGSPLSEMSELLLHTKYAPRGSKREKLAQFLDAVDRREGNEAAALFTDNCIWRTNTKQFGDIIGLEEVAMTINSKLPKLQLDNVAPGLPRHRLASPVEGTDVVTPNGELVHFDVVLDETSGKIKSLTRNLV